MKKKVFLGVILAVLLVGGIVTIRPLTDPPFGVIQVMGK